VFTDKSLASQRRYVFHAVAMAFSDARMECVAQNGDLPSIDNAAELEDIISNVTAGAAASAGNSTAGLDYY